MRLRSAGLLAALACALCLNGAQAATANASVAIVEITLTDLDVNDGITPSLQLLTPDFFDSRVSVTHFFRNSATPNVNGLTSFNYFEPLQRRTILTSSLDGTAAKTGTSLDTLAISSSLTTTPGLLSRADASSNAHVDFLLSPNTSLSITFDLSVQADAVFGDSTYARADAWAMINYEGALRPFGPNRSLIHEDTDRGTLRGKEETVRWTGTIDSRADALDLNLQFATFAQISPVPEPQTWGMLLAGLALAGAAARRKRTA